MLVAKVGLVLIAIALAGFAVGIAFKKSNSALIVVMIYASTGLVLVGAACWLIGMTVKPKRPR